MQEESIRHRAVPLVQSCGLFEMTRRVYNKNMPRHGPVEPAAETVNVELTCHCCRYNLRGLSPAGKCPECGESIENSVAEAAIRSRRPAGIALGLGIGSCAAVPLILAGPLMFAPFALSLAGMGASAISMRHWRYATRAQRTMSVLGAIFSVTAMALMGVLIYGLSQMHIC